MSKITSLLVSLAVAALPYIGGCDDHDDGLYYRPTGGTVTSFTEITKNGEKQLEVILDDGQEVAYVDCDSDCSIPIRVLKKAQTSDESIQVYGYMYPAISKQGKRYDSLDRRASHDVFKIELYDNPEISSYQVRRDSKVIKR